MHCICHGRDRLPYISRSRPFLLVCYIHHVIIEVTLMHSKLNWAVRGRGPLEASMAQVWLMEARS